MNKKWICALLALVLALLVLPVFALADQFDGNVAINATNFPDKNFRSYLYENFEFTGINEEPYFTPEQIAAVKTINVCRKDILKLDGIEYFTALTYLDCSGNYYLDTLDVSKNSALEYLNCSHSNLGTLDVSHNTKLKTLNCECSLAALDVSNCISLEYLNCSENYITSLDVSQNTALKELICWDTRITSLDVSKNTALKNLCCSCNSLKSLDLSNNTALQKLECDENSISSLDLTKNSALEYMNCQHNVLASLDLSKNTKMKHLSCCGNEIKTLDISKNPNLRQAYLEGTKTEGSYWVYDEDSQYPRGYIYYETASSYLSIDDDVTVTTIQAPRITTQPKNASVEVGKKASFKVKATGEKLKYQWYVMKSGSRKWAKVSKATKATLKVKTTAKMNGWKYRCKVYNTAGYVYSKTVKLKVKK